MAKFNLETALKRDILMKDYQRVTVIKKLNLDEAEFVLWQNVDQMYLPFNAELGFILKMIPSSTRSYYDSIPR